MQTLTDIRIYTGITRCNGPDVSLKSVNSVGGAELHVYTSEGERYVIEVPDGGVYDNSIQPMPQYEHACKNAESNVLATLLRGADGKGVKGGYFDEDGTLYLIMEDASEVAVGKISLDNYYTKTEVDAKRLANPHTLSISVNGDTVEYDGQVSISLPAIYAPLSQGGSAQVLVGGSPAPQWVDVSKLAGVKVDWSNIGSKPTTIKGYGITDCYTKTEVDPTIGKANSALQSIISPEPEDGDYVSVSVGKKTGSNTQEVRVAAHIAKLNTSADGLVSASDARAYVEQAKAEVTENIGEQGFAKDLTGVIEATPEEFTYRPSAGNRSIRDASAVIRRIKGNTVVFAQLADLRSDLRREGDWSVAPEVTANMWAGLSNPVQVIAGHKYLFYINKKDGRSITDTYTLLKGAHRVDFDTPLFITAEETASWGWTALYKTSTNGLRFQTQAFDLTRLFDAGNEPKTIEEFKSSFPDSYYPYGEPEVRNVKTIAIHTVGLNQWDERWELGGLNYETGQTTDDNTKGRSVNYFDVLPSTAYYCHTKANTTTNASGVKGAVNIVWYDSNKSFIKYQVFTNTILTSPANARYAKIYTVAGDVNAIFRAGICINLSHSGVRNGEYEPYVKHVRQLPEIIKNFPDGMNGNSNVWDEINAEKAIKRWGVVDLGSLTWVKGGTGTSGVYRWLGKGIEHLVVKTVAATDIPNIVCAKYILSSASNIWATTMPMQVSLDPTGNVLIYDSGYNAGSTTTADFTAHLQGVFLYYELAEPIETPITEAIQLDYEVDDFGTEKAFAFGNNAPFRADIVYQFNAEGRIRDNSRNIERLEGDIDNLTPTFQASLGLPYRLMAWDGSQTMLSLPIAKSITDWEMEESPYGTIPTGKQVKEYVALNAGGGSATSLFPQEQWSDTNLIAVASNVVTVLTIPEGTTGAIGAFISDNDVNMVLGKDNEWALRFQVPSTGVTLDIAPLSDGKTLRWANGEVPTWEAGKIYECSFRLYGDVFLGVWSSF